MTATRPYTRWDHRRLVTLDDFLAQGYSDERAAAALGTTPVAVNAARGRYGIDARYRQGHSQKRLARMLGVTPHVIRRWNRNGWLPQHYRRSCPGGYGVLLTSDTELMNFLANPEYWHAWRWEAITDRYLRLYCRQLRGDVVYVGSAEAAEIIGVVQMTVDHAIRAGRLPARRDGRFYRIRLEDVERYREGRR